MALDSEVLLTWAVGCSLGKSVATLLLHRRAEPIRELHAQASHVEVLVDPAHTLLQAYCQLFWRTTLGKSHKLYFRFVFVGRSVGVGACPDGVRQGYPSAFRRGIRGYPGVSGGIRDVAALGHLKNM